MAAGVVHVEGKTVTLDQKIIDAGIEAIRMALSEEFPDIENAEITIDEPKTPGAVRTAEVVKRGMTKGGLSREQERIIAELEAAPEYVNPAIALAVELMEAETAGDKGAFKEALRSGRLERAIAEGEREGRFVRKVLKGCSQALPSASTTVPEGF